MNKKLRKIASLVFACSIFATGCAGTTKPVDTKVKEEVKVEKTATAVSGEVEPGYLKTRDEKVKLSWYINYSWFPVKWGEDTNSQAITEETGIDIEFIVPAGNEAEKLNTMIASDTLPDILTIGWWEPQINQMIEGDMVYALNELADQYDPYFFKVADEQRLGWYTKEDGNVYGYPNYSYSPADYEKYNIPSNMTYVVRKDMYEAIGSPDMSTPEGFISALKKAKEMFPTVNNQPLIPIGLHEFTERGNDSLDAMLLDFLAVPYEKDGQFYDRFTDPETVKWLKAFRELGADGLLPEDIFIDKRAQMEEKIAQGRYFSMLYQRPDFAAQQKILFQNDPNSIYIAIDGPRNAAKDPHTLSAGSINGWTLTLISKKCKHPERAIQLISYFMSEKGQKAIWYGVEGIAWDDVDGKPVVKPEVKELLQSDRVAYDKKYGGDSAFWMLADSAMNYQWTEGPQEPLKQLEEWTYDYAVSSGEYGDVTPPAGSDEELINLKLQELHGQALIKLLLAKTEAEFDTIYNDYLAKRDEAGFRKIQEYRTVRMNENKKKLGL